MATEQRGVWVLHGADAATAASPFFPKQCVGIGWVPTSDLSKIEADRPSFRALVTKAWPERAAKGPNSVGVVAGQLYRFVHELKTGDLIVLPLKRANDVQLGYVASPYRYDPGQLPTHPHVRSMRWLGPVPKSRFSPEAIREIGSALAFFRSKNYAREFLAAADAP